MNEISSEKPRYFSTHLSKALKKYVVEKLSEKNGNSNERAFRHAHLAKHVTWSNHDVGKMAAFKQKTLDVINRPISRFLWPVSLTMK